MGILLPATTIAASDVAADLQRGELAAGELASAASALSGAAFAMAGQGAAASAGLAPALQELGALLQVSGQGAAPGDFQRKLLTAGRLLAQLDGGGAVSAGHLQRMVRLFQTTASGVLMASGGQALAAAAAAIARPDAGTFAQKIDALYRDGKWADLITVYETEVAANPTFTGERIPNELYIVALNKRKAFAKALAAIEGYLQRHAHGEAPIDLAHLAPLDAGNRKRSDMSSEVLAAAGKAFRELADRVSWSEEEVGLILRHGRLPADSPLPPGTYRLTALDLSTRFYEAAAFVDGSYYGAINAAHGNARLGRLARAERFAWMAQRKMRSSAHGSGDYWSRATALEAALLTRDHSRVAQLFGDVARFAEHPWMTETTARTLRDTSTDMGRVSDDDLDETGAFAGVVGFLTMLQHNPGFRNDPQWLTSALSMIESAARLSPFSAPSIMSAPPVLPGRFRKISEDLLAGTVDVDWRQTDIDLNRLYREALVANEELKGLVERVAVRTSGTPIYPPATAENPDGLKGRRRAEERVAHFLGDASMLTDIARASIVFDDLTSLYRALEFIGGAASVIAVKDRFVTPYASGYRDVLLRLRMGNGHVVELQLHLRAILDVKNGEGHVIYERRRALLSVAGGEGRGLTTEERRLAASYDEGSRRLYDEAYLAGLGQSVGPQ